MIIAKGITKTFYQGPKAVLAVKDAGIEIQEGERVYIHGPSGAGKSTLLHVLGGLSRPAEGAITFRGDDIYRLKDSRRSRLRNECFGFIFQFYHLLSELNVLENVMLPAMIKGTQEAAGIKTHASRLLKLVGMKERLKHRPNQLSGGEAQRVAIARALINSPCVLFCDEPTGNLDSARSKEVYDILYEISENKNMSIVIVSHEEVDEDFFHTEYIMKDGDLEKTEDRRQKSEDRVYKTTRAS